MTTETFTLEPENYRPKDIFKYRHLSPSGNRAYETVKIPCKCSNNLWIIKVNKKPDITLSAMHYVYVIKFQLESLLWTYHISCSTCCLVGPVKATWVCASFDSNLVIISCSTTALTGPTRQQVLQLMMTRLESKLAQIHVALTGPTRQQVLQLMMTRLEPTLAQTHVALTSPTRQQVLQLMMTRSDLVSHENKWFIKMLCSIGPSIERCGTPESIVLKKTIYCWFQHFVFYKSIKTALVKRFLSNACL